MKRFLYTITTILLTSNVAFCSTVLYAQQDDDNDERFAGWTEEQYRRYEDSVFARLYPPVIAQKADSTLLDGGAAAGNASSAVSKSISNSHVPGSVTLDKANKVGEIPIKSGTTPTGAKTYKIPIEVYPGMRNFQPKLSLDYNSQQGNSVLGMGWAVSGLPMVSRGGKTIYYDGKTQGIMMDNTDAFILDGVRLVKTGTATDHIIYESEQGNIKAKGYFAGNIMKYFEVFYPEGYKGVFGYTSNSQNQLYYPLMSLTDMKGNTITYSYLNNHYNITKISYNGASVEFQYTTRQDPLLLYSGGLRIYDRNLLQSITCKLGTTILGTYTLYYSIQKSVSLLTQVSYTAAGSSYNPIRFYYGEGLTASSYTNTGVRLSEWYTAETPNMVKVVKGRFDYDSGTEGMLMIPNKNPYWKHHRNSSTFRHSQDRFDNLFTGEEKIYLYSDLNSYINPPMPNLLTEKGFVDILTADLNGKLEECIIKINNSVVNGKDLVTFKAYQAHTTGGLSLLYTRTYSFPTVHTDADGGKSIQPKFYYTGDFNGDGKMEVMAVSVHQPFGDTDKPSKCYVFDLASNRILYQGHVLPYNVNFVGTQQTEAKSAANNTDRLLVMDYDGDGKTDICHINASGTNIYTFDVSGSILTARKVATYTNLNKSSLTNREILLGEFNGDGLMDLLVSPSSDTDGGTVWTMFYSKGNGLFDKSTFNRTYNTDSDYDGFIIQDINGDGLTDLVKYQPKGFYTYPTQNNSIGNSSAYTSFPTEKQILIPTNINNYNSFTQLLSLNLKDGVVTKYSFSRNDSKEMMATGMANSLGVIEKNRYQLTNDRENPYGLYNRGYGATYPYVNLMEPIPVVIESETYVNGSKIDNSGYVYENAVIHRQGLGFCGFERIKTYNKRGQALTQTYEPYRHGLLKSETAPACEKSYTYTVSTQANKISKIRLTRKVEKDLLKGTSATTSYVYDTYGYPTEETTSYTGDITVKKTNTYSSKSDVGDGYNLGFQTDQVITVTRGGSSYTERVYIPVYSQRTPIVKVYYKDGNYIRQNVYAYDGYGNITKETATLYTSSNRQQTSWAYDPYGRLVKETYPTGLSKQYTYNSSGRLASIKDKWGGITTFTYDAFGRETSVTNPDGTIKRTTYDWSSSTGKGLYTVTHANTGHPTTTESYDALKREVSSSEVRFNGTVKRSDKVYDAYGNLQRVSLPYTGNAASLWNTYTYDRYDRILSCAEASGRKTTYSYSGSSVTTVEDKVATTRTYDALGYLISATDPAGTITYNLDADGQPSSIVAPGGITTSFSYDKYRRLSRLTDPSQGSTWYEYDDAGNVSQKEIGNGKAIQYEYDQYNRIIKETTPEFSTSYSYNDKDELIGTSSDNGTSISLAYDALGRLSTRRENAVDGIWLQKDYTYDNGNVETISYTSQSGKLATEKYNYSNGHLSEVIVNGETTIFKLSGENSFGQPTEVVTGNITRKYAYTPYGLPSRRSASIGSKTYQGFSYVFDPTTNNLMSRTDNTRSLTENFGYDNLNRLTSYGGNTATYDAKGNITGKSDIGTFEYELENKPYAISGATLSGNGASGRAQVITYTSFGSPMSIKENNHTTQFIYNGEHDRVRMNVNHRIDTLMFRYYLGNNYEATLSYSPLKEELYLMGDYYNAPAVYVKGMTSAEIYYILRDYQGSITHIMTSDGTLDKEFSYDAWGHLRNPDNHTMYNYNIVQTYPQNRGYTGHEPLAEFGLINMNARLYDPALGRFLSPDPYIQMPDMSQNLNRYTYALNNPLKYKDPDGQFFLFTVFNAVTDFVGNVFSHGFNVSQYDWTRTVNAWKIDMGMFKGSPWQVLNKWTYGYINSVIGNTVSQLYNTIGKVDRVTDMDGMLALSGATKGNSSVTIGHYSLGPNGYVADWRDHLFVHEYGHYMQTQMWGPLYFPVIAFPSIASAAFTSGLSGMKHNMRWFEVDASKLGARHFDKYYGRGADGYVEGSKDFFDINIFKNGYITPYINPRTGTTHQDKKFPDYKTKIVFWDFIL